MSAFSVSRPLVSHEWSGSADAVRDAAANIALCREKGTRDKRNDRKSDKDTLCKHYLIYSRVQSVELCCTVSCFLVSFLFDFGWRFVVIDIRTYCEMIKIGVCLSLFAFVWVCLCLFEFIWLLSVCVWKGWRKVLLGKMASARGCMVKFTGVCETRYCVYLWDILLWNRLIFRVVSVLSVHRRALERWSVTADAATVSPVIFSRQGR